MRRRHYLTVSLGLAAASTHGMGEAVGRIQDDVDEPDPLQFEGTGPTVTDEFDLEGGVTIAEAVHDGESNFIVELVPTEGEYPDLLVNAIGAFDGASGVLADGGAYLLDVDADGPWELTILQPRAATDEADSLPIERSGEAADWIGPVLFDGLAVASATHEGQGNFIVEVLPQDGFFPELVFNELDRFEGESTLALDGVGYVTIEASGPWTLTLE